MVSVLELSKRRFFIASVNVFGHDVPSIIVACLIVCKIGTIPASGNELWHPVAIEDVVYKRGCAQGTYQEGARAPDVLARAHVEFKSQDHNYQRRAALSMMRPQECSFSSVSRDLSEVS